MSGQDQPPPQDTAATGGGRGALDTALAYHQAWTSHDFERAMTYIADDIVCQAPAGALEGAEAFRGFMGPFVQSLTRSDLIAAFGDDQTAVVMYDTDTVPVSNAPGGGVRNGKRWQDHPHADHLRSAALRTSAPRGQPWITAPRHRHSTTRHHPAQQAARQRSLLERQGYGFCR
jgi:hypothetical protein